MYDHEETGGFRKWFSRFLGLNQEADEAPPRPPIQEKDYWEDYIPMTKKEAMQILKRDLPRTAKVSITVKSDGTGAIGIHSKRITEDRRFDLQEHTLDTGSIEIKGTGRGIGRLIMRNEINFFRACGVTRFNICAASSAGGYTWARFGFLPDRSELKELRSETKSRLREIAHLLKPQEKDRLKNIIKFKNKEDIWQLADMRLDLTPRLRSVFNKVASKEARALRDQFSDEMQTVDAAMKAGKPMPLGRFMLAGLSWSGHLDFHNRKQMNRVKRYVGGLQ